jgi:uncharacterized LabA/DUF88 family protein
MSETFPDTQLGEGIFQCCQPARDVIYCAQAGSSVAIYPPGSVLQEGACGRPFYLEAGVTMNRSAVFVDAGYLFAAGSALLGGSKQSRHLINIDEKAVVSALRGFAQNRTGCDLLRVYWYDGVTAKGLTVDHQRIASCDDIKLRLGFINSAGQQKGVDSLIVTDLVELARNGAICDAILVAGDEDTRIGVQIAQSYGVRVHLLGIEPARSNQSRQLIQEADTTSEWGRDVVTSFLTLLPGLGASVAAEPPASPIQVTPQSVVLPPPSMERICISVSQCAMDFAAALESSDIFVIGEHWTDYQQIPKLLDGRLLASTRERLHRNLTAPERTEMRVAFLNAVRERHPSGF